MLNEQQMLEAVKASPAAVAVHDKSAWLALFAPDAEINDPVGSRTHRGQEAIARFYETFIAPNSIHFEVDHDVVCGQTMVRDATIHTEMPTGLKIAVPTHIRYVLREVDGQARIQCLCAHWELRAMVKQSLSQGWLGMRTYGALSARMLRCQGVGGMLGFSRGFAGVARPGKRRALDLMQALMAKDIAGAQAVIAPGAECFSAYGARVAISDLAEQVQGLQWSKVIASGRWVSATVLDDNRRGAIFMRLGRGKRIERVVLYLADI